MFELFFYYEWFFLAESLDTMKIENEKVKLELMKSEEKHQVKKIIIRAKYPQLKFHF